MKTAPDITRSNPETVLDAEKPRNWGKDRRLAFIDFRLRWERRLNRLDLKEFFQISTPQASLDIADYTERAPNNLAYDRSSRVYVTGAAFEPIFSGSSAEAYLNQLLAIEAGVLDPDSSFIGWRPPVACIPTPERKAPENIVLAIVDAIRAASGLAVTYLSMSGEKPEERLLSPQGLGHDGFRWHVRAYCHARRGFRDFVLGRMIACEPAPDLEQPDHLDVAWNTFIPLILVANPALSLNHRRVIEQDYGMENGEVAIECRQALLFYTLKRLGLDTRSGEAPNHHHIVLKNRAQVATYLS